MWQGFQIKFYPGSVMPFSHCIHYRDFAAPYVSYNQFQSLRGEVSFARRSSSARSSNGSHAVWYFVKPVECEAIVAFHSGGRQTREVGRRTLYYFLYLRAPGRR
jgi:hypothetical protein